MMKDHGLWWPPVLAIVVVAAACLAPIPAAQGVVQRFGLVRLADGTSSDPSLGPQRNKYDGWYFPQTGVTIWSSNGSPQVALSSKILVPSYSPTFAGFCFAPNDNVATAQTNNTADTGLARVQAGVLAVSGCDVTDGGALKLGDPGVRPACSVTLRGTLWIDNGAASVKDSVAVCAKDGSDVYDWRVLY